MHRGVGVTHMGVGVTLMKGGTQKPHMPHMCVSCHTPTLHVGLLCHDPHTLGMWGFCVRISIP